MLSTFPVHVEIEVNTLPHFKVPINTKLAHHAKMDLNKMLSTKKKTIQTFKVDAKGFRKTMN